MSDFRVDTLDVELLFLGTSERVFAAMYEDSFCGYKCTCEVEQLKLPIKVFGPTKKVLKQRIKDKLHEHLDVLLSDTK